MQVTYIWVVGLLLAVVSGPVVLARPSGSAEASGGNTQRDCKHKGETTTLTSTTHSTTVSTTETPTTTKSGPECVGDGNSLTWSNVWEVEPQCSQGPNVTCVWAECIITPWQPNYWNQFERHFTQPNSSAPVEYASFNVAGVNRLYFCNGMYYAEYVELGCLDDFLFVDRMCFGQVSSYLNSIAMPWGEALKDSVASPLKWDNVNHAYLPLPAKVKGADLFFFYSFLVRPIPEYSTTTTLPETFVYKPPSAWHLPSTESEMNDLLANTIPCSI